MNALMPNERREMSFRLKHSPALRGGTQWFNRVTLVQKLAAQMPIFEPMSCEALKRQVSSLPFSLLLYVLRIL